MFVVMCDLTEHSFTFTGKAFLYSFTPSLPAHSSAKLEPRTVEFGRWHELESGTAIEDGDGDLARAEGKNGPIDTPPAFLNRWGFLLRPFLGGPFVILSKE